MHVVILAGGFGTRLKSAVNDVPKPLAPVKDKCFLYYLISSFKQQGFTHFTLCLHYMADKIIEYFGDGSNMGISIDYNIEPNPMGTGGAIGLLRNKIKETFCVVNGDTFIDAEFESVISEHRNAKGMATVCLSFSDNIQRYGEVKTASNGRITEFCEKKNCNAGGNINAGYYVFEPEIFQYILPGINVSLEKDVFPRLVEEKAIYGFLEGKSFTDIGVPEDYYRFCEMAKNI